MMNEHDRYPAFQTPAVPIPASTDNNLPDSELSIDVDTAPNNATQALDYIKESATATKRCFIAGIMGRRRGYLTLMNSLSSGAECIYLNGDVTNLQEIAEDSCRMVDSFKDGCRLFLILVNGAVSKFYDRGFLVSVYEAGSEGYYDVRYPALGYLQQGGTPSPFDRFLTIKLTNRASEHLQNQFTRDEAEDVYIDQIGNHIEVRLMKNMLNDLDTVNRRPFDRR